MTRLDPTSAAAASSPAAPRPADARRPAARTVMALTLVGLIALSALLVWHPRPAGPDGTFTYQQVAAAPGTWWAFHTFGGLGCVLASVAVAILLVGLVRERGRNFALTAAALQLLGGTLFALGLTGEGTLFSYLVAPELLPAGEATTMLAAVQGSASPQYLMPLFAGGGLLQAIVPVPMAIALLRSRSVARWIGWTVAASAVVGVGQTIEVLPSFGFGGFVLSLPFAVAVLGLAWSYLRRDGRAYQG